MGVAARYYKWLGATLFIYVLVYSAFLWHCDGFPYVCDNNETFSALWHAHNLYHFSFWDSFGVTDEACSPHAAAHPFLYTHEGNFPRLLTFVLYAAGAHSPQSHIVITTLTIGLATILLGFHFFARRVNSCFACVAMCLLMTDYVLFMQWQVVTFRVWHCFFFFAALLCIDHAGGGGRAWLLATSLTFLGLFYYEPVFVLFLTTTCFVYAVFRYAKRPRMLGRAAAAAATGATIAIAILLGQLLLALGPDTLKDDIYYTILARQFVDGSSPDASRIMDRFNDKNLVFLENFVDGSTLRTGPTFLFMIFHLHYTPYTAYVTAPALMLLGGLLVAVVFRCGRRFPGAAPPGFVAWVSRRRLAVSAASALFLAGTSAYVARHMLQDVNRLAQAAGAAPVLSVPASRCLWAVFAATSMGMVLYRARSARYRQRPLALAMRVLAVGGLFVGFSGVFRLLSRYYEPLNFAVADSAASQLAVFGGLLACFALVASLVLSGIPRHAARPLLNLRGILFPVVAAGAGYGATFMLFSGYLKSGYHDRWISMLVPCTVLLPATALYLALELARGRARLVARLTRRASRTGGWLVMAVRGAAVLQPALVAVVLAGVWIAVQRVHFRFMSPDQFQYLARLHRPHYAGASFIVSSYASPTAWGTGQWAYADLYFSPGNVQLSEKGYLIQRDLHSSVWLADRKVNAEYVRPDYFVMVRYQNLDTEHFRIRRQYCRETSLPNVRRGSWGPLTEPVMGNRVVEEDPSGLGRWAIVKLNWNFPPYCERLGDLASERVRIQRRGDDALSVDYRYRHQEGEIEGETVVRLHLVDEQGRRILLEEKVRGESFALPSGLSGNLQASVIPATASRRGEEFLSNFVPIGGAASKASPTLRNRGDGSVRAALAEGRAGPRIDVDYDYEHAHGEAEKDSRLRLYLQTSNGDLLLLNEVQGTRSIAVPPASPRSRRGDVLRVGVIPRTEHACGREYFAPAIFPVSPEAEDENVPRPPLTFPVRKDTDGRTLRLLAGIPELVVAPYHLLLHVQATDGAWVKVRETIDSPVIVVTPGEYSSGRVTLSFMDPSGVNREIVGPIVNLQAR